MDHSNRRDGSAMGSEDQIKLLTSKQAIQGYIRKISGEPCSEYMFKKYIGRGMPARFEDSRWLAYADNIDEYFRAYTRFSVRESGKQDPGGE